MNSVKKPATYRDLSEGRSPKPLQRNQDSEGYSPKEMPRILSKATIAAFPTSNFGFFRPLIHVIVKNTSKLA